MMKGNIVSTKLIKPCIPTPHNLSKYKISFIDELNPPVNINIILFYHTPNPILIIRQLEDSLANILPQFYPLAGRYVKNDHTVYCNDEGVEFVLAEAADIELSDLTTKTIVPLNDLLSRRFNEINTPTDPLLSIQITRLKRGDLAIGISVSHQIFDASSLGTFVAAWSNANGGNAMIAPSFDSPMLFPGKNLEKNFDLPKTMDPDIVVKRLLFSKEDIENLRSKLRTKNGDQEEVFVSRVRLVTAFISKALIRMHRANYGKPGDCFKIVQRVNIRERTIPPLPKHSCGNLAVSSVTRLCMDAHGETVRFEDLIYVLGEAIRKTITVIGQELALGKEGNKVISDSMEKGMSTDIPLVLSDWGKFGFYEADFGSGKPVLVGFGTMPLQYATTLVDNKEVGGIEAWVHVKQRDLPCFERYVHMSEMEREDF